MPDTVLPEQTHAVTTDLLLARAESLIATARQMNACGLNQGTSGNLSVRIPGGLLITPGSLPYDRMGACDLLAIDVDGHSLPTPQRLLLESASSGGQRAADSVPRQPSSEWRLHAELLAQRSDVDAVLHCHSIQATALACHGRGIPPFHYMVAIAGGADIRCAPYVTFGTRELSRCAAEALVNRRACLLAHHGQVVLGADPAAALALAVEVETLAAMYLHALQLGEPPVLSDSEMQRVLKRMRNMRYGELPDD